MTAWDQILPRGSRRWWISLIVDLWNWSFPTQINIGAIAALDLQRFWPRWVKPQPHTAVHEKTDGGLVKAHLQKQNPSISPQRCCFGRLCAGRDVAAARNNTFFMASPPWHFSAHTHVSVTHPETAERRQRCNILTQQLLIICSPRWNFFLSK